LRALTIGDGQRLEKRLRALRPIHKGARIELRGGFDRPPLERVMSAKLFGRARSIAQEIGVGLGECCAGGGSDGNLTAALGVPTLDGLGAVGDGAHSPDEFILVAQMAKRSALLAQLLLEI